MTVSIEELKKYPWPLPNFPIGQEVADRSTPDDPAAMCDDNGTPLIPKPGYTYSGKKWPADYTSSNFIPEEKVQWQPVENIPYGSCGISSMILDGKNLYGISGKEKLFLFCRNEEKITSVLLDDAGGIGWFFRCQCGIFILADSGKIFDLKGKEVFSLQKKIRSCCGFPGGVCAVSEDQMLLAWNAADSVLTAADTGDKVSSTALAFAGNKVYGFCNDGMLFCWDFKTFQVLDCVIPSFAGRRVYNHVPALIADGSDTLYGGTSEDGIFFRIDLKTPAVKNYGKPLAGRGIFLLCNAGSRIFGIGEKNCAHIFEFDKEEHTFRDLGMINMTTPRTWCLYEAGAMLCNCCGKLIIGENERISHIFTLEV